VGRALSPHAGFFSGWIMLMYYTIGTTSLTIPLGTYLLSFFSNAAANDKYDVALVGTAFNLLVLAVAALGIRLSARFQWGWAIFEYGLLVGFGFAAAGLIGSFVAQRAGHAPFYSEPAASDGDPAAADLAGP
jgi:amino acid transporter